MTATDGTDPWDVASLRRVAETAHQGQGAADVEVQLGRAIARLDAIRRLHRPTADRLCRLCCITSDDDQSQDCADHHDHSEGRHICATVVVLDADLGGAW